MTTMTMMAKHLPMPGVSAGVMSICGCVWLWIVCVCVCVCVADDIPDGRNAPFKNQSEEAAVCVAHAYCHFDKKEYKDALRLAKNGLSHDGRFAPALRMWGLVEWYQGHRSNALVMFKKSLKAFPMNPYCLRNYAVASALCGHYAEAVAKMKAAAEIGGNICSLAWRAAGQMSYIYDRSSSGKVYAAKCCERAFDLSGGVDMEAGRLQAQVLMEMGLFEKAVEVLRAVLPLKPCDPVGLGSLGLCLSALGFVSPKGLSKINYDLKIKLMDDPVELSRSNDPEELFEAATTFNLGQVFMQVSPSQPVTNSYMHIT
jgi:tetratricopeptide (TPR) repeat protein